jgi:hypothetical protein
VIWRKSSYSGGNGGNCIEVGTEDGASHVLVRDGGSRHLQGRPVSIKVREKFSLLICRYW